MRAAGSVVSFFLVALWLVSPSTALAAEAPKEVVTTQGSFPLTECGLPEQKTIPAMFDELDYQGAVQTYLWAMPQMTVAGQHHSNKYYGAKSSTDFLYMYKDPSVPGMLTPNTIVQYIVRYGFDWLMVMSQAYQESRLDHSARNKSGAIGIMQIKASTAADKNVNIADITNLENNIHAGIKYLRFIRDRYFEPEAMDDLNKTLFSFAAYNAGPSRITRLRKQAASEGLNPDIWFDNVEVIAARRIGIETVQYVSNIYKYWVAYRLSREQLAAAANSPERV
jgi:hypothetical protein